MASFSEFMKEFSNFINENKLREEEKLFNLSGNKIAISGSLFLQILLPKLSQNPCKGILY